MSRLLSAIILGGSIVIGAFLMSPPRYEGFPVDNEILERLPTISVGAGSQSLIHGVFDSRTGEVCYRVSWLSVDMDDGAIHEVQGPPSDPRRCPVPSEEE